MTDDFEESEGLDDDSASLLQRDIAERLATLSDVVDTPTEFDMTSSSFDPADVDFVTGSWMQRLAEVQGWLRLELEDELPQDAESFLTALVTGIGHDPTISIDDTGSHPQLTIAGLGHLFERVDQAVRLQQTFIESYNEDASTRDTATAAWNAAWEDESWSTEPKQLAPVSATTDTWRISDFTGKGKKLNLTPSYQRGDVWGTPARQLLIESILRGIPLPSVILLKPADPSAPFEVVDGKQRLTAILRFVGKHEVAVAHVRRKDAELKTGGKLEAIFQTDYPGFKKLWKSLTHQAITSKVEDEYYFPFRLRNNDKGLSGPNLEPLQGKYFSQITEQVVEAADELVSVSDLFDGTPLYRVPVIVYRKADHRTIHEVFNLYNKQGVHLNAEEIRNAIYHEVQLTRALLAAAGDSDRPELVAPSLDSVWSDVEKLGPTLKSYGFGEFRYKRTKVLAWVVATLLGDTKNENLPSTARHIDDLLKRLQDDGSDPLNQDVSVGDLFRWVARSATLHAAYGDELWSPEFKRKGEGQKWQELQLVGSLVGIAIAYAANPEGIEATIDANAGAIFDASATAGLGEQDSVWARPKKATTKSQWAFIAKVAREVTKLLGVDTHAASEKIRKSFGSSGVESLFKVIGDAD